MMTEREAVVAVVTSERGVLLVRRRDGQPEWSFPGGAPKPDELYADAVVRECREQTAQSLMVAGVLGHRAHPITGVHVSYVACLPVAGERAVQVCDPEAHSEVAWVPWHEARERLVDVLEPVAEHLEFTLGPVESPAVATPGAPESVQAQVG